MTGKTIFVLDDSPADLALMGLALRAADFDVETFGNGHALLRRLDDLEPDLVVTDVMMDDMQGIQMVAAISMRCPGLPILAVSGHAEYIGFMCELGAAAGLHKSIGFEHRLPQLVNELLTDAAMACA